MKTKVFGFLCPAAECTATTSVKSPNTKADLRKLSPHEFTDRAFGVPTVADILKELEKPGRDPRPAFKEGIETLDDLKIDMILEGVVSNVTNFGAFVDIGVHQDGLVHISQLSYDDVKAPRGKATL